MAAAVRLVVLARVTSAAVLGVDAFFVDVEVDVGPGLPGYHLVGLPASTVREGRVRIRAALANAGFRIPSRKIVVNLAPADVRKEGAAFDLPIALGVLVAEGALEPEHVIGWLFLGELALDGSLRPVRGVLPAAVLASRSGLRGIVVPAENQAETRILTGLEVIAARRFAEVVARLRNEPWSEEDGGASWTQAGGPAAAGPRPRAGLAEEVDLNEVRGQQSAKRALEVAAAGGHNLLLVGPPGSGKTMLARRLPTLLPALTFDEALEVTSVWSVAGLLGGAGLVETPPFRAPHHTVSDAGLVGGGSPPRPGEVSLAHRGVLFLDELPEFRRSSLECLRQPLEDQRITISRARQAVTFPASFTLVAAMNPCRCGHLGDPRRPCRCSLDSIRCYRGRLSGPLLDRIDLQVEVPVPQAEVLGGPPGESSADVRARVSAARERQRRRHGDDGPSCNAGLTARGLREHCELDTLGARLIALSVERLGFSARARDRILKVARTIADLAGSDRIAAEHVAEAIQYRTLDRDPASWAPDPVRAQEASSIDFNPQPLEES